MSSGRTKQSSRRHSEHLRVLFVISRLDGTGGAGRSVGELVQGMRKLGVEAEVACFARSQGALQDELEHEGVPIHVLDVAHMPTAVWCLRRLLRQRQPDLVHTTLYAADQAGRMAAWNTRIPVVSSIVNPTHDPALFVDETCGSLRRRLLWALDGWTARHLASHIHALTHALKESAVRGLRVPEERVTVVHRSRDARRLGEPSDARLREVRRSLGLDNAMIVLTIGRQAAQKGQIYLIEAFADVAARHENVALLLAGIPGPSTSKLQARVRELELEARVRFLGHREDVGALLAAADVFAFPSLYEGLGAAVIEAMALGTPIVASDLPALREITGDGDAALLVPLGNAVGACRGPRTCP